MDYVLTVMLYVNGPMVTYRVPNCEVAIQWLQSARSWAVRNRLDISSVRCACGRVTT